ncbi:hypothetical protein BREVNS_1060 [Brevinematales bacterium NS]|nr:hypothetical protein BREVNS_1060 [Brevinematales bacterium NS]
MQGCFLALFRSGTTPLFPAFFFLQRLICFFKQKLSFIMPGSIVILFFVFYYFLEAFALRAKAPKLPKNFFSLIISR